jgi:hypothetical protein
MNMALSPATLDTWLSRDRAAAKSGRKRRVAYPLILQVATDYDDENGNPVMVPVLDKGADAETRGRREGRTGAG